ncbi:hypothetical protein MBM_02334 [Drepanopeziza brunnea f. sp. 'multigermtubi' MB_m1]|uniref:Uncharacterized protein n=1 Tax=Marssonina brunnea f. sp. multigermtubi (strain MB_m1) TaxID=1072389 RepID=K1X288_MARBU|nr:uncharacterized protein MBM_02334 [Drepanopeziza brunnea f. sp. 'multigermtubi' MB_m1]EKD19097.1 hypothetical protein MBM_02334 [Drepanopeziza brunnea f. sp. 'multigermtubi' MB_m1]
MDVTDRLKIPESYILHSTESASASASCFKEAYGMQLNSYQFPDNSKIETYSQSQQQLIVNQNPAPLPANHVVGSTGQSFVALSPNSMTIQTNGAANLVAAQIELPIDPAILQQNNVSPDNTFVAMLSPGRQTWVVMEGMKSVNTTDNTVRIVKMTNIDGEYMAVGRQSTETSQVLTQFGSQSVNITGSGIQEAEFADGLRMSMKVTQPMTLNTDVVNGISSSMITVQGMMPVNNYRYLVTTNLAAVSPSLNSMVSVIQLPLNMQRVMAMAQQMGVGPNDAVVIGVAQRTVLQNPGGATGNLSPQRRRRVRRAASSGKEESQDAEAPTIVVADSTETAANSPESMNGTSDSYQMVPTDGGSPASADGTTPMDGASNTGTNDTGSSPSATSSPSTGSSTNGGTNGGSNGGSNNGGTNGGTNTSPQSPAAAQLLLSPTFTPITSPTTLDPLNGRVMTVVNQIDGEFILTMQLSAGQAASEAGGAASAGRNETSSTGAMNRASSAQPAGQAGVTVSMATLAVMLEQQTMGGALAASAMMEKYIQSQGKSPII